MAGLNPFDSAETAALQQVAALQNAGDLVTNATVNAAILAQNGSWAAPYVIQSITLDASGNLNIARSAKIHFLIVNTFGATAEDTLSAIVESNTWSDGDVIYLIPKTNQSIAVALASVAITIRNQGDYLKLVRVYGVWSFEASFPRYAADNGNVVEAIQMLAAETSFVSNTNVAVVDAVTGGTPAAAVYEVTAVTGAGNEINLYVDGILIANGNDGSSIDNMGTDLETKVNAGTDFTAAYNAGTNRLTITDARSLGTIGNSFLLSNEELNGAAGTIITQFTGGINGVAAAVTIDTINGLTAGKILYVHNGMSSNVTLTDVGGNLEGTALPLTIAPLDFAIVSCIVAGTGRVR